MSFKRKNVPLISIETHFLEFLMFVMKTVSMSVINLHLGVWYPVYPAYHLTTMFINYLLLSFGKYFFKKLLNKK